MSTDLVTPTPPESPTPSSGLQSIFLRPDGLRAGWRLAIFILIFCTLVTVLLPVALRIGTPPSSTDLTPAMLFTQEVPALLALLVAVIVMWRIERRPFDSYGLPPRLAFGTNFWRGALWGLVMIAGAVLAIAIGGGVSFNGFGVHGWNLFHQALLWAAGFFLVGLWEESFFRGYALATLADGIGFWPAASVLSALFGGIHLLNGGEAWTGVPQIFLISMLFCLTLRRTGSLWFAVGMHAAWDFGETFIFSAPDSGTFGVGTLLRSTFHGPRWLTGGVVGPEGSVIGVLAVILAMLIFARLYPERS
jgi:membrane protease YdiL (CAAX protease family)